MRATCRLFVLFTIIVCASRAAGGWAYFVELDEGRVRRCTLQGSSLTTLYEVTNPFEREIVPYGVAQVGGAVYWTDASAIKWVSNTGGSPNTVVGNGGDVRHIELNPAGNHLYWTDSTGNRIMHKNLTTGVEDVLFQRGIFADDVNAPQGIAVDTVNNHVYWTENGVIKRGAINGIGSVTGLISVGNADGIALDVAGGKMYWVERNSAPTVDRIRRADLDGTDLQTLYSGTAIGGGDVIEPVDLDLDIDAGKIYWSENGAIKKANMSGSGTPTVIITTGIGHVKGISIHTN